MSDRLAPEAVPRRDFIGMAGLWAAGVAVLGSILGMGRLTKPVLTPEVSGQFRIGSPAEFAAGTVKLLPEHRVRIESTPAGIAAISLVCTHLGCIVHETSTGFKCPCHGSVFTADGAVIGGPAPRGLRWLAVSLAVDGQLLVNSKSEVQPGTYLKV